MLQCSMGSKKMLGDGYISIKGADTGFSPFLPSHTCPLDVRSSSDTQTSLSCPTLRNASSSSLRPDNQVRTRPETRITAENWSFHKRVGLIAQEFKPSLSYPTALGPGTRTGPGTMTMDGDRPHTQSWGRYQRATAEEFTRLPDVDLRPGPTKDWTTDPVLTPSPPTLQPPWFSKAICTQAGLFFFRWLGRPTRRPH